MLNGLLKSAQAEASRTATRGALYAYAGLMAAIASVFVAAAIVVSLKPVTGPGPAWLCGGVFLLLISCTIFLIARAASADSDIQRQPERKAEAASASEGLNYAALFANGLASGMLEKELEQHPVRMLAAALAAGTVMGIMEAQEEGK